jgi:transcription elongation factor Elf1
MKIAIELSCPHCQATKIKKNGNKSSGKQNYMCKNCGRQLIGDHALNYKRASFHAEKTHLIDELRGVGVRDMSEIEDISIVKVWSALSQPHYAAALALGRAGGNELGGAKFGNVEETARRKLCTLLRYIEWKIEYSGKDTQP